LTHVQQVLGHADIKSTMLYINLEKALFNTYLARTTAPGTCRVLDLALSEITPPHKKPKLKKSTLARIEDSDSLWSS
jgi:hypothetical protein